MTGTLPGADVRGFYMALGIEFPGWAHTEAPVRCFADPDSHQQQDRKPSCSVNLDSGAFNCHGCGAHGGAYDAALATGRSPREAIDLMFAHGLTDRRPRNTTSHRPTSARGHDTSPATVDKSVVRAGPGHAARSEALSKSVRVLAGSRRLREWTGLLRDNRELLERLRRERGWEPAALRELGVGFDGTRITVPITDERRSVHGLLRLRVDDSQHPKVIAAAGTRLGLIPHPVLEPSHSVVLVEGPSDMVAARSAGLPAIAVPGANAWRTEWADALAGRDVAVVMDCDRPGRQAALRIASDLERRGATHIQIIDLAPSRDDGYDLSDWLCGGSHEVQLTARAYTRDEYQRTIEAADRTRAASAGLFPAGGSATASVPANAIPDVRERSRRCARF